MQPPPVVHQQANPRQRSAHIERVAPQRFRFARHDRAEDTRRQRDAQCANALHPPEQLAVLDVYLPEKIEMANSRRSRITYAKDGPPVLSARIQELYGIEGKFTLGHGRVPVKIEVLAPNQRPIQVTDDLGAFWRDMYPKIKAELSRRYPRLEWR